MSQTTIAKTKGQRKLASLWLIFTLLFISFCVALLIPKEPKLDVQEFITWLLPLFLPNALLIVTLFIKDETQHSFKGQMTSKFVYRLTLYGALFYFVMVFVLVFGVMIDFDSTKAEKAEKLKSFNLLIGTVQGIVTSLLGIFFTTNHEETE
jgi:formate hydrogenlyase subunit 3/multisubunit Na+/H+ antiporter MnhD subunit